MRKLMSMPGQLLALNRRRYGHPFENKEEIILRDYLAMERTKLANERTILGYTRTSLFFVTGGITLVQLKEFEHLSWLGYGVIILSVVLLITGLVRYLTLNRRLNVFYKQVKKEEKRIEEKRMEEKKLQENKTGAKG